MLMRRLGLLGKQHTIGAGQAALQVENLSAGYPGNRYALDRATFQVAAGERVAIIGPNGAGKSTLLKAIVGVLPFTSGEISIYGADCYSSHNHVGYVPQQSDIDWSFPVSVFDVVLMGRSRHIGWFRLPSKADRALAHDILEHLSLSDLTKRQISELSGGQRRRVFIARALAQEARILVLDEPFAGIDQGAEQELIDTLDILTRHHITLLIATHHKDLQALRFDKVLLLNREVLDYGAPETVLSPERLLQAYGPRLPAFSPRDEWLPYRQAPANGSGRGPA